MTERDDLLAAAIKFEANTKEVVSGLDKIQKKIAGLQKTKKIKLQIDKASIDKALSYLPRKLKEVMKLTNRSQASRMAADARELLKTFNKYSERSATTSQHALKLARRLKKITDDPQQLSIPKVRAVYSKAFSEVSREVNRIRAENRKMRAEEQKAIQKQIAAEKELERVRRKGMRTLQNMLPERFKISSKDLENQAKKQAAPFRKMRKMMEESLPQHAVIDSSKLEAKARRQTNLYRESKKQAQLAERTANIKQAFNRLQSATTDELTSRKDQLKTESTLTFDKQRLQNYRDEIRLINSMLASRKRLAQQQADASKIAARMQTMAEKSLPDRHFVYSSELEASAAKLAAPAIKARELVERQARLSENRNRLSKQSTSRLLDRRDQLRSQIAGTVDPNIVKIKKDELGVVNALISARSREAQAATAAARQKQAAERAVVRTLEQQIKKYGLVGALARRAANLAVGFSPGGTQQSSGTKGGFMGQLFGGMSGVNPLTIFSGMTRSLTTFLSVLGGVAGVAIQAGSAIFQGLISVVTFGFNLAIGILKTFGTVLSTIGTAAIKVGSSLTSFLLGPLFEVIRTATILSKVIVPGFIFGGLIYELKVGSTQLVEFDEKLQRVVATLNSAQVGMADFFKSPEDAATRIGALVRQIAVDTTANSEQVMDSLMALVRSGIEVPLRALKPVVKFSIAAEITPEDAGSITASVLNQFGMSSELKDVQRVTDGLLSASLAAGVGVRELGEAMKNGAGAAKLAGVSFEEFLTVSAAVAKTTRSGGLSGNAVSRGLARSLAPPTGKAAAALENALGRVKKTMKDFTDESGQSFRQGGFIDMIKALEEANVKLPEFQTIFAERGKQLAAALGDPNDLADGYQKLMKILNAMAKDQAGEGLVANTADKLQNSWFGVIDQIKEKFGSLRLSVFYLLQEQIVGVTKRLNEFLSATLLWVQTSDEFRAALLGVWNGVQQVGQAVLPLIGYYLRLSAVLTTVLIASLAELARMLAGPVLQAFQGTVEYVAKLIDSNINTDFLNSWEETFKVITGIITNFGRTFQIVFTLIKIKALDAVRFIATELEAKIIAASQAMENSFRSMFDKIKPVVVTFADFLAKTIGMAMKHAMQLAALEAKFLIQDASGGGVNAKPSLLGTGMWRAAANVIAPGWFINGGAADKFKFDKAAAEGAANGLTPEQAWKQSVEAERNSLREALRSQIGQDLQNAANDLPSIGEKFRTAVNEMFGKELIKKQTLEEMSTALQNQLKELIAGWEAIPENGAKSIEDIAKGLEAELNAINPGKNQGKPPGPGAPAEDDAKKASSSIVTAGEYFKSLLKSPDVESNQLKAQKEILAEQKRGNARQEELLGQLIGVGGLV